MPTPRKNRTPRKSMVKRKTLVRQPRVRGFHMTMCDVCGKKLPSKAATMRGHAVVCPACNRRY